MLRLAVKGRDKLFVSDYEIKSDRVSYTIYTVEHFRREFPEDELFLLVGSDMLLSFDTWHRFDEILGNVTLCVVSRQNGDVEEQMIMSDIGVETSEEICDRLRKKIKERGITDPKEIMGLIHEVIAEIMGDDTGLDLTVSPAVIMVIGVNGAGKTTTIGKLCHQFRQEGKKVLVAAADTFRAAAIDQLEDPYG